MLENTHIKDAKNEVEDMKKDIQNLTHKLGNITGYAKDLLTEQMDHLSTAMSNLKDKGMNQGKDAVMELCMSTRRNPIRNLAYAFLAGVAISIVLKK